MAKKFILNQESTQNKLQIREELIDISKRWVQTGEVTVHKEIFREEKNIVVPVTREELVIEKKVIDKESVNEITEHTETIRIPISEERIEVIKHPGVKEDVAIYKRQLQENEHVQELLKREKINVETTRDPEIIYKET